MSNILNIASSLNRTTEVALAMQNTTVGAADVGESRAQMVDIRQQVRRQQQERAAQAAERRDPTVFARRAREDRGAVESKGNRREAGG